MRAKGFSFEYPPVADTLATGAILHVTGTAATTISPGRLSGPLSGDFVVYPPGADIRPGGTAATAPCKSNNHQFLLSR
jgi:hypothetical protein